MLSHRESCDCRPIGRNELILAGMSAESTQNLLRRALDLHQASRLGDAERTSEPLGEGGLPGTHLSREHDDVTLAGETGEGGGDGVGVHE